MDKNIFVDLNLHGNKIKNVATPLNNTDAVNKAYVDHEITEAKPYVIQGRQTSTTGDVTLISGSYTEALEAYQSGRDVILELIVPDSSQFGGRYRRYHLYAALGTQNNLNFQADISGNKISFTLASGDVITNESASGYYEITSRKVTSLSSSSTDQQYPSAKCVYDMIGDIESALNALL